jgi:CSLREA domain-containing protein
LVHIVFDKKACPLGFEHMKRRQLLVGSWTGTALLFLTDFARSRFSRESSGQRRKWVTLAWVALFSFSFVAPSFSLGILFTVNSTGDGDNVPLNGTACDDGTPQHNCTLRAAIQSANNASTDDTIDFNLPAGSVINLTKALPDLSTNILITGPGADKLTVQRDSSASTQFRIFNVTTTGTVTFSGLTISKGITGFGGGVNNSATGTVNVINSTISGNSASAGGSGSGGGISNASSGTVNVTNSTLSGNNADHSAGGIYNHGTLTITNSTLSSNANGNNISSGGGIYNDGTLTITNSTLSSNNANGSGGGGGIYNSASAATVNITNSTISGNNANANGNGGGGIYNSFGGAPVNITNSTISGNSATSSGAGIHNDGGTVNITNSTISGNSATSSSAVGGGIDNNGGTVNARNTIIAQNTVTVGGSFPDFSGTLTSQGFNLIGNTSGTNITGTTTGNQLNVDPKLDPSGLKNNGGPTQTIALLFGSPAIDKGANTALTALSSAINNSTTAINVTDASNIPAGVGYTILIDSEQMVVTSKSGNSLTVTRAANSTTAAAHSASANLFPAFDQRGTGFPRTFNDPAIPNATGGDNTDIGAFEVQTTPPPPPTPTATPTATPTPTPGSLGNVSTRLQVGTGDNVLFAGFIIQGNASKTVLIRSAGPSLTSFGVPGALGNPQLELHDVHNTIGTNDNWQTTQLGGVIISDQVAAIQNSGLAPLDPAEPAIIATLAAGQYTAIVQGVGGAQGIATVEVYDLSPNNGAILANISTRGFIQTGDNVMIGGFIVVGQSSRVFIRATGPSLIPLGINNALANPRLELHDKNGTLAGNDDWQTTQLGGIIVSDQSAAIQNSGLAPKDPAESAIIATLAPGAYTAIAQGVNGGIGVGLIEVFALP